MDAERLDKVQKLGRRVALQLGCDPDDGSQEAVVYGLEVERNEARGKPLTTAAFLGRVHLCLMGRWSRLRKQRPLCFDPAYAGPVNESLDGEAATDDE
jgi:hypothetical protein